MEWVGVGTGSALQRRAGGWRGLTQVDVTGPAAWVRAGRAMLTYGLGHSASLCCSRWGEGENEGRESGSLPSASPKYSLTHPEDEVSPLTFCSSAPCTRLCFA